MTIESNDFKLIPISESSPFFDLELLFIVRPKGKESREEWQIEGYGMPLEAAIKRIIQYRLSKKHIEEALSLKQYLTEYIEEFKNIDRICQASPKELIPKMED